MAVAIKPVILELVELDNPPYCYVEDTINLDDEGEGILYDIKEFCEAILKGKHYTNPLIAKCLFDYLMSGWTDTERDVKHLARAFNLAHGLER